MVGQDAAAQDEEAWAPAGAKVDVLDEDAGDDLKRKTGVRRTEREWRLRTLRKASARVRRNKKKDGRAGASQSPRSLRPALECMPTHPLSRTFVLAGLGGALVEGWRSMFFSSMGQSTRAKRERVARLVLLSLGRGRCVCVG